jgi:hypothetical protein
MRTAREHGVPGIGAREIAAVERTLARVVCGERESIRAVARMFRQYLERGNTGRLLFSDRELKKQRSQAG